jgi:glycosyl transferase family 25
MTSPTPKKPDQICPIWVINLDRSIDRMASVRANLVPHGVAFERIQAVDAAQLSDDGISQIYDTEVNQKKYFSPLKKGEIACFLSHRLAWQALLDSAYECAVIIEDDVVFDNNPLSWMDDLATWLAQQPPTLVKLFSRREVRGKSLHTLNHEIKMLQSDLPPLGTQAQMLNRQAAKLLLQNSTSFSLPVDVALQAWWETGVNVLTVNPNIAREVSAGLGGSTLSGHRSTTTMQKIIRELKRPVYRLNRYRLAKLKAWRVRSK